MKLIHISTEQVEEKNQLHVYAYTQGTGKITINDRDIDDYFGLETLEAYRSSATCSYRHRRKASTSFAE